MKEITLNGLSDDLAESIRRVAERENISLEQAALRLLRKGASLEPKSKPSGKIGHSLDQFMGTMSEEEAEELQAALRENHVIDESAWR